MENNKEGLDKEIMQKLLKIGKKEGIKNKYFKQLKNIRKDPKLLLGLGVEGLIKKDYKNFIVSGEITGHKEIKYGISTFKIPLEEVIEE